MSVVQCTHCVSGRRVCCSARSCSVCCSAHIFVVALQGVLQCAQVCCSVHIALHGVLQCAHSKTTISPAAVSVSLVSVSV